MKLYYKSGACSLSPHIALRESGLKFDLEQVDLATKKTESGADYFNINPKGQVPALLLDNGTLLTEGVAIIQYVAAQAPEKKLMPPITELAHYQAIEWLNYVATELHKGFGPLFIPNTPEETQKMARKRLEKQFSYLNKILEHKEYLLGSQFSVADGYLFTILGWAKYKDFDLSQYPALTRYIENIAKRPAVVAALKAEGLV